MCESTEDGVGIAPSYNSSHTYSHATNEKTISFLNAVLFESPTVSRAQMDAIELNRARRMAKRTRTEAACQPCKIKKARCSDTQPCHRCIKSEMPAVCVNVGGNSDGHTINESCFNPLLNPKAFSYPSNTVDSVFGFFPGQSVTNRKRPSVELCPTPAPNELVEQSGEASRPSLPSTAAMCSTHRIICDSNSNGVSVIHPPFQNMMESIPPAIDAWSVRGCMVGPTWPRAAAQEVQETIEHHLALGDDHRGGGEARGGPDSPRGVGESSGGGWAWEAAQGPGDEDPFRGDWPARAKGDGTSFCAQQHATV